MQKLLRLRSVRVNYTINKLNIPKDIIPISLIAIGCYDDIKPRKNVFDQSKVHLNKW